MSVIIPVYNEQRTIGPIFERVCASPVVGEVIIVDDGSTDGTRDRLAELRAPPAAVSLVVVLQPRNQGKGAAVRAGFQKVTRAVTIVQDADLEYDPADYEGLLLPILDGKADVVFGVRFHGHGEGLDWMHHAGNRALTLWSNLFTGLHIRDVHSCYKAIDSRLLPKLRLKRDRFDIDPEITTRVARLGLRVREATIRYVPRRWREGKKIGWFDAIEALATTARLVLWP